MWLWIPGIFLIYKGIAALALGLSCLVYGRYLNLEPGFSILLIGVLLIGIASFFMTVKKRLENSTTGPMKIGYKSGYEEWFIFGIIVVSTLLILAKSVYFPFIDWDVVALYGRAAKSIYESGGSSLKEGAGLYGDWSRFPPGIALSYVHSYILAGARNEFVAMSHHALFSLSYLLGTVGLARQTLGRKYGMLAALILVLSPLFTGQSGSGYTDIPAGAYVVFSMLCLGGIETLGVRRALIAGSTFFGLAAWAKASSLPLLPVFLLIAGILSQRENANLRSRKFPKHLWGIAFCLLILFVTGGWWYLRNWIQVGTPLPVEAVSEWRESAGLTLQGILPFRKWNGYGVVVSVLGVLGVLGFFLKGWDSVVHSRKGWAQPEKYLTQPEFHLFFMVAWFYLVWVVTAPYTTRYLLVVFPLMVVVVCHGIRLLGERFNGIHCRNLCFLLLLSLWVAGFKETIPIFGDFKVERLLNFFRQHHFLDTLKLSEDERRRLGDGDLNFPTYLQLLQALRTHPQANAYTFNTLFLSYRDHGYGKKEGEQGLSLTRRLQPVSIETVRELTESKEGQEIADASLWVWAPFAGKVLSHAGLDSNVIRQKLKFDRRTRLFSEAGNEIYAPLDSS